MAQGSEIVDRYLARTRESAARNDEAKRTMPGGDTRSTAWFAPYPPFVAEGRGAYFTDVDGNRYVELLNNYTSLIHGHARPEVVEAIQQQVARGSAFAAPHDASLRLSQLLVERMQTVDRVRFANSGTEAVMMAIRLARAYTGRQLVGKAEGGYHGTWDDVTVSVAPPLEKAGPADRPTPYLDSKGLNAKGTESTVVIPFNDIDSARAILEPVGAELACVIVEPVMGAGGMIPCEPEYLAGLRELTREVGALLVLDEVISLRLAPGGAQNLYGVEGDLTTMAKIIGGGLPVGAFGGPAEIMDLCDPSKVGHVPHYGSFNGNPATMAGGLAAMKLYTPDEYDRINALGDRLREGVNALGAELGLAVQATGMGSLLNVHLVDGPIRAKRDVARADPVRARLFHLASLNEGLFPAGRGLISISTAMDESTVDEALEGIRRAVLAVHAEQPIPELSVA
jgi:glutamate-1-semialdehyde 2,1-aminomutase